MDRDRHKIAFLFSGTGTQWPTMAQRLLEQEPLFFTTMARCDEFLRSLLGWSLLEEMRRTEHSRMHLIEVAWPALFALQIALVALWRSWGVEPDAVMGYSAGEAAAAYTAGILSLEGALRLVYQASRLDAMLLGSGDMMAVGISEHQARMVLAPYQGHISLAAINSPSAVTISGEHEALRHLAHIFERDGTFYRALNFNYAFHSPVVDSIQEALLTSLSWLCPQQTKCFFPSTLNGTPLHGPECSAEYWFRHNRYPVRFTSGMQQLIAHGTTIFLEISPHPVLASYVKECLGERQGSYVPSLHRLKDDRTQLLASLSSLSTLGYPLASSAVLQKSR